MDSYRIAFMIILAAFIAIRGAFDRWALLARGSIVRSQAVWVTIVQIAGAGVGFGAILLYLFLPSAVAWAMLPLPSSARWLGVPIGCIALGLLVWAHIALGRNFSGTVLVRAEHHLITRGPYRYVRHPMYTALYLLAFALFLLSANGVLTMLGFGYLTGVIATRLSQEEQYLVDAFGEPYRAYMRSTGRFLPRW